MDALGLGLVSPMVGMTGSIRPEESLADAMQLAVVCSEDLPRLDENEIDAATAGTFLGDALLQRIQGACAEWPRERPVR